MPTDAEAIAEQVFTALADPTRRVILATLATQGPATATDLADRLPITRQAIAKHLVLLANAGLVTAESGERRIRRAIIRQLTIFTFVRCKQMPRGRRRTIWRRSIG